MDWEARFWSKVDRRGDDECWPWIGVIGTHGYGEMSVNGRGRRASQLAWEVVNRKPFPKGLYACHSCDVTWCVNPAHIWAGTPTENVHDSISKGRWHHATHCKRGHEFTPANTIRRKDGWRSCRECQSLKTQRRRLSGWWRSEAYRRTLAARARSRTSAGGTLDEETQT